MNTMDCSEVRELLHSFEDAELPASERAAMARHIEGCDDCRGALNALQSLRRRMHATGTYTQPPNLERRVREAIGILNQSQDRNRWWRIGQIAASHLIVAALAAGLSYAVASRSEARQSATRDVVAAHVRSLQWDQPVQVATADTHTVKPWFTGKIPFAPDVVDLAAQGFPLLGGRLDYVMDRPAAALVYGRRMHRISLFILPDTHVVASGDFRAAREGHNVVSWRRDGFAYFAVSDLNAVELQEFAQIPRRSVLP